MGRGFEMRLRLRAIEVRHRQASLIVGPDKEKLRFPDTTCAWSLSSSSRAFCSLNCPHFWCSLLYAVLIMGLADLDRMCRRRSYL